MTSRAPLLAILACSWLGCGDDHSHDQPADAAPAVVDAAAGTPDAEGAPDAAVADASPRVPLAFTEVAFAPEWLDPAPQVMVFNSAAEFTTWFGVAPPAGVDFDTQSALFYSAGRRPYPGTLARVTALEADGTGGVYPTIEDRLPGNGCATMEWKPFATTLITFAKQSSGLEPHSTYTTSDFDCVADGAAADATCDRVNLCGPGLICSGLTRFTNGWCRPTWMWQASSESLDMAIPDNDAGGLVRTASISGLATVDEDVIVRVELDHPDPSELLITITNPATNEVTVWNHETGPGTTPLVIWRVPIGFSGDEQVNGTWTLEVADTAAGNTGRVLGWTLEISSRLD